MSNRTNITEPYKIISAGVMTGTSVLTSSTVNVTRITSFSVQAVYTGTPTGTFSTECSLDGVSFSAVTLDDTLAAAAGAASNDVGREDVCNYKYFRVKYTNSSGTGSLDVYFFGKET